MAFGDTWCAGTVRAVRKLAKRYRCNCVWKALLFVEIFQINHISNDARTTRLLNFNLISRAELSNGDVEASSASPERSPPVIRVEAGSGISDGEWLCCVRQ
jgi:hypothetical protein